MWRVWIKNKWLYVWNWIIIENAYILSKKNAVQSLWGKDKESKPIIILFLMTGLSTFGYRGGTSAFVTHLWQTLIISLLLISNVKDQLLVSDMKQRGRSVRGSWRIFGSHFFVLVNCALIFWYVGRNVCLHLYIKFHMPTPFIT